MAEMLSDRERGTMPMNFRRTCTPSRSKYWRRSMADRGGQDMPQRSSRGHIVITASHGTLQNFAGRRRSDCLDVLLSSVTAGLCGLILRQQYRRKKAETRLRERM